jgi:hypothetical protein
VSYPTFLSRVEGDVRREREAQDAKWGEQNHADGTGGAHYRLRADVYREQTVLHAEQGRSFWDSILKEEVYEALAETDPEKLRAELVQVAAVAQAWAEAIDRRAAQASAQ